MSTPTRRVPDMPPAAWAPPEQAMSLDDHTRSLLEQALGVRAPETPPVDVDSLELPESRLSPQMQDMLAGVVG
ncbi:MAG: hypothetical protein ACRDQA_11940, partial [Nocardioidaceae bacterium]